MDASRSLLALDVYPSFLGAPPGGRQHPYEHQRQPVKVRSPSAPKRPLPTFYVSKCRPQARGHLVLQLFWFLGDHHLRWTAFTLRMRLQNNKLPDFFKIHFSCYFFFNSLHHSWSARGDRESSSDDSWVCGSQQMAREARGRMQPANSQSTIRREAVKTFKKHLRRPQTAVFIISRSQGSVVEWETFVLHQAGNWDTNNVHTHTHERPRTRVREFQTDSTSAKLQQTTQVLNYNIKHKYV